MRAVPGGRRTAASMSSRASVQVLTSAASAEQVADAGADAVVDRDDEDLAEAVRRAASGTIDVVADGVVGGWVFEALLDVLGTGGRWVTCGAVAGPVVELDPRRLYLGRRQLIGSTLHTPDQFSRLVEDAVAGRMQPVVAQTFALSEIHAVQAAREDGDLTGKLVLLP